MTARPIAITVALVAAVGVLVGLQAVTREPPHPAHAPQVLAAPWSPDPAAGAGSSAGPPPSPVSTAPPSSAGPDPSADTCTATVEGTSGADIDRATAAVADGVVCFPAGRYPDPLRARVAEQRWLLAPGAVLAAPLLIEADGFELRGGRIEVATDDPWAESVTVRADDVVIDGLLVDGGGLGIGVHASDRTVIRASEFTNLLGTAIFLWGDDRGTNDTVIDGNRIRQDLAIAASPISSRAADDPGQGIRNSGVIIRSNTIDQGDDRTGWFGVELKLSPDAVVEGNRIRGGQVLVSLADSDGATVRDNELDLEGSPYWGVEIASSDDVTISTNEIRGDGRGRDSAVSMNSGSIGARIVGNVVEDVRTFVDLSGDDHRINDNCLTGVGRESAYRASAGRNVVFARNGACS